MGCAQSTETNYYLGFINVNISHMDLFSFFLGICVTVGMLYIIRCIRTNRKIHRHILGGHPWAFTQCHQWLQVTQTLLPLHHHTKPPPKHQLPYRGKSHETPSTSNMSFCPLHFSETIDSNFRFAKPDELHEKLNTSAIFMYIIWFKLHIMILDWFMISILHFIWKLTYIFLLFRSIMIFLDLTFYDILFYIYVELPYVCLVSAPLGAVLSSI